MLEEGKIGEGDVEKIIEVGEELVDLVKRN